MIPRRDGVSSASSTMITPEPASRVCTGTTSVARPGRTGSRTGDRESPTARMCSARFSTTVAASPSPATCRISIRSPSRRT